MKIFKFNEMKHYYQPTGNSCGPACIKTILNSDSETIEDIVELCGTDWKEGTPPYKMERGLDSLNIDYDIKHGFNELKDSISNKKPCLLRTVTKQVPHWIVIYGYYEKDDYWFVNDPWLGKIQYDSNELDEIWKVRDYFYYEINDYIWDEIKLEDIKISSIDKKEIENIINITAETFKKHMSFAASVSYLKDCVDFSISIKATYNDELIGFYLLNENKIPYINEKNLKISVEKYKELQSNNGLEGVALVILPDYRKLGISKLLIEESYKIAKNLDCDYVWGEALKTINNLNEWSKVRTFIGETDGLYITAKIL